LQRSHCGIGQGGKYLKILLNNDVRKAIDAGLELQPKLSADHPFIANGRDLEQAVEKLTVREK